MDYKKLALKLLDNTKKAGATQAEVVLLSGEELEIEINKKKMQKLNRATMKGVGLRVYVGKRMSFVYSSDFTDKELDKLVEKGVALAKEGMEDKFNILPSPSGTPPELDIFDPELANIDLQKKIDYARELDELVFQIDSRVANTRASSYSDLYGEFIIANTNGLVHSWQESYCGVGTSPVIEDKGLKQVAYYGTRARYYKDIPPAKGIAEEAVRRASLLIGGEKVKTQKVPVVFDFRVGTSLIGGVLSAVNGERVFRGESFLVDKLEETIGSELVTIVDDGLIPKGMGSSPVDGEGVATSTKKVVDKGVLKLYLYDSYTANKVGTKSTGNASRGSYSSRPSIGPNNFYLEKGDKSPEEIIKEVSSGFYVFNTMGGGVNPVTGMYSAGAAGVWIRNGELAEPVAKVTIAATLFDMLKGIDAVGNDLRFDSSVVSPTYRVKQMTVSGR